MTLTAVLIFAGFALVFALLARLPRLLSLRGLPCGLCTPERSLQEGRHITEPAPVVLGRWRNPILLVTSVLAIYWMQPALPIRGLDFWLPTATLIIACLGWALTATTQQRAARSNLRPALLVAGTVLVITLTRYFLKAGLFTPSRPPQIGWVVLVVALVAAGGIYLLTRVKSMRAWGLTVAIVSIILLFVVLKLPQMTLWVSAGLRSLAGQSAQLASATDLRWLGFSYIAFRLMHTLRDRQSGRLPEVTLEEYLIYMLFFPAFTAGPIDRIERFIKDLRAPYSPQAVDLGEGAQRLFLGLFKKFALADTLALIALSAQNAGQVRSAGWLWLLLYAYTFQLFFDFSGYTDIAIGLGRWLGIRLPENFNHPYLKPNLTQFWNNWHITLTMWFRAYFFYPLTRALRGSKKPVSIPWVILITQLSTMLLIGLWHGTTFNFALWGLWHGLGLFLQNRWTEFMKPRNAAIEARPRLKKALTVLSTVFTFHYVALGWVWFALPSASLSMQVFVHLFGAA